jgi:hypothetical protein
VKTWLLLESLPLGSGFETERREQSIRVDRFGEANRGWPSFDWEIRRFPKMKFRG